MCHHMYCHTVYSKFFNTHTPPHPHTQTHTSTPSHTHISTPSHTHTSTPSHTHIVTQGEVTPTGAKHWSVAQFMTPDKVTASHHDSSLAQTPPSHKEIHNVGLITVECFLGVSQVSSISYDELELHVTLCCGYILSCPSSTKLPLNLPLKLHGLQWNPSHKGHKIRTPG